MIGEMLKWIERNQRFGYGELDCPYHEGKLKYIDKTKRGEVRFEEGRLQFAK